VIVAGRAVRAKFLLQMEFVKNGPRDEGVFTFSQEESVEKALAVHGSVLEGRHIIVDLPEKNDLKYEPTSCKVDAGADVIEEDIWQLLEGCGSIKAIRLKHDSRKAHVLFEVGSYSCDAVLLSSLFLT